MRTENKRRIARSARAATAGAVLVGLLGASWWLTQLPVVPSQTKQPTRTEAPAKDPPVDGAATETEHAQAAIERADRLLEKLAAGNDPIHRSVQRQILAEALQLYQSARARFAKLGNREGEAAAWKHVGATLLGLRRVEEAVAAYRNSAAKAEQAGASKAQIEALIEAGKAVGSLGRPHEAIELYQRARRRAVQTGQREGEANALAALADQLRWIGEVENSLSAGQRAGAIWRELNRNDRQAWTLSEIGRTNSFAGRDDEALELFDEALRIHESTGDLEGQIDALTEIGWTLHWLDRSEEAVGRLRRAIELSRRIGKPDAGAYDRLATAYRKLGRLDESRRAYRTAINLLDAAGERFFQAHVLANLAELRVAGGEPRAALGYCAQAKEMFQKLDDPNSLAHTLYIEASALRDLGRLEEAHELMREVRAKLESQRAGFNRQGILEAFSSSRNLYREFFVDLLMDRHAAEPHGDFDEKALEAIEEVRGRSLREALLTKEILQLQAASPELKRLHQSLRAAIDALDREKVELLQSGENRERLAQIDADQKVLLDEFDGVRAQLKGRHSVLEAPAAPRGLTVRQIQEEILDDNTLLLTYSLGERRSFLWLVGRSLFETRELPPRRQLDGMVESAHQKLSEKPNLLSASVENELSRLSEALFGQIQDRIEPGKRLVVIPDDKLQYVPFVALPFPRGAAPGRRLIEDHEIVSLPSVSTLDALRKRSKSRAAEECVAVWADAVFGPQDPRLGGKGDQPRAAALEQPQDLRRSVGLMGLQDLPRLPGSLLEAKLILELAPEDQRLGFFGFDAGREGLTSGKAGRCKFLHLASHTLLNPLRPELSGIVLSLFTPDGRPRPGFLRAHHVAQLNLSAEVVVLSACQTAAGKEIRGEGISGLPHSFMLAGVPRVVMSLWPVSDAATPELMSRFYEEMLREQQSPSAALRAAQLSMIAEPQWRAPYHWAAFVLLGEWEKIG